MVTREFFKCLLAISHSDHLIVLTLKISRDRITDGLFIFDEKNATCIVATYCAPYLKETLKNPQRKEK